ncbi:protein odr-4 homolog isoform X2 [Biomphalaria glabrata]|uniref:Protein odr-4 homolog isoform X2 n=1 Tax=Biomphalaria glabrata TaxID=6526 RepID=A0A9W3BDG2_BIOGL|nr:protein odr-4 homolog isoform X2 [Biomphalaria glabrata]
MYHLTAQRNFVVHLTRTPDPVEDEVSEENGEDESGDAATRNVTKKPDLVRPNSLDKLDEKWVYTHAKQVSRMLPGGLNVIGLFALAPSLMLKTSQSKLKQILYSLYKNLNKNVIVSTETTTDRILLQLDTSTKKLSCTTIDASDIKSAPKPSEWKYHSGENQWVKLTSLVNLDIPICVSSESKHQTLIKQLQVGLVEFGDSIKRSIITFNGLIREPSESLLVLSDRKGRKDIHNASDSIITQDVVIYLPLESKDGLCEPKVKTSQATINMIGTTVIRAFVSTKATVRDAIEAVKMDIIRSLMIRCELLCEEFNVTEGKQGSEVYDPPVRLFCQLPQCGLEVCDYVFQDEKQDEVKERIKELLDIEVEELEETEKSAADDGTWSCPSSLSCMSSHQSLAAPQISDNRHLMKASFWTTVGCLIAVVASWMSYQYMYDE